MEATQLFKALSDPTRLRCLVLLVNHEELCVCELTYALNLPQPKVSHHLGSLRKAGLVSDRKMGLWVYYQLNKSLPEWAIEVLQATTTGITEDQPFRTDTHILQDMPNRPGSVCSA
ncbi:MAG: metalloregulator ArsR/SmtB family transcription factor [Gammaproteobacteria bacterium]|nr:metalloregulator ArsR/SmtB family transcription factor [Gammaproteobacteria bacterium]